MEGRHYGLVGVLSGQFPGVPERNHGNLRIAGKRAEILTRELVDARQKY
jgi:hypothetical protein